MFEVVNGRRTISACLTCLKCLNNQFSRNTEEQFKKEHTGAGWQGAIELTENALAMQLRFGRL